MTDTRLEDDDLDRLNVVNERELVERRQGVNRKLIVLRRVDFHAATELKIDDFQRLADDGKAVSRADRVGFARDLTDREPVLDMANGSPNGFTLHEVDIRLNSLAIGITQSVRAFGCRLILRVKRVGGDRMGERALLGMHGRLVGVDRLESGRAGAVRPAVSRGRRADRVRHQQPSASSALLNAFTTSCILSLCVSSTWLK